MAITPDLHSVYAGLREVSDTLHFDTNIDPTEKNWSVTDARQKLEHIITLINDAPSLQLEKPMEERIAGLASEIYKLEPPSKPSQGIFPKITNWASSTATRIAITIMNSVLPSEGAYQELILGISEELLQEGVTQDALYSIDTLIQLACKTDPMHPDELGIKNAEQVKFFLKINMLQFLLNVVKNANQAYEKDPCFLLRPFEKILKETCHDFTTNQAESLPPIKLTEYADQIVSRIMSLGFPDRTQSIIMPPSPSLAIVTRLAGAVISPDTAFAFLESCVKSFFVSPNLHKLEKILRPSEPSETAPTPQKISLAPLQKKEAFPFNTKGLETNIFNALRDARRKDIVNCLSIMKKNKNLVQNLSKSISTLLLELIPEMSIIRRLLPSIFQRPVVSYTTLFVLKPSTILSTILEVTAQTAQHPPPLKKEHAGAPPKKHILDKGIDKLVKRGLETWHEMLKKKFKISFKEYDRPTFIARIRRKTQFVIMILLSKILSIFLPKMIRRKFKDKTKIPTGRARLTPMLGSIKKRSGKYAQQIAEMVLPPKKRPE